MSLFHRNKKYIPHLQWKNRNKKIRNTIRKIRWYTKGFTKIHHQKDTFWFPETHKVHETPLYSTNNQLWWKLLHKNDHEPIKIIIQNIWGIPQLSMGKCSTGQKTWKNLATLNNLTVSIYDRFLCFVINNH